MLSVCSTQASLQKCHSLEVKLRWYSVGERVSVAVVLENARIQTELHQRTQLRVAIRLHVASCIHASTA